jgi:hypothetical protein
MSIFPLVLSFGMFYGYCVVEVFNQQVCSEIEASSGNFAGFCNAFTREEDASSWMVHFSSNLRQLENSQDQFCDVVRNSDYIED